MVNRILDDDTAEVFSQYYQFDLPAYSGSGWSYTGSTSDDQITGSQYLTQNRFHSGLLVQDVVYGNDTIDASDGNDGVNGAGGNDIISGGSGNDSILGGTGNDALNGNTGNDVFGGGDGNDTVRGGQNDDTVAGDAGADFISGDAGNDVLYGGTGSDTFNFSTGFGADTLADFNRGEGDSVRIEAGSYTLAQVGANTIVTMSDGSTLTILNTTYSSLDSGWIHS